MNNNPNNDTQQTGFGIGRIIVLVATILAVLSFFLAWIDIGIIRLNAFAEFQSILGKGSIFQHLFGLVFLVFIYPVWMTLAKKHISHVEQVGGFLCAVTGIITGIVYILMNQKEIFGESVNVSGSGVYLFLVACVLLIAGIALYNRRML